MELFYAGVGSRRAPPEMRAKARWIAGVLARRGYTLRNGAAEGMDEAFEQGCDDAGGAKEIWLPWNGYNGRAPTGFVPTEAHFKLAATMHPAWDQLGRGARALHAYTTGQALGLDLATPVSFVLCWTPDGCESEAQRTRDTGGTATAIVLASRHNIPVFNLAREGSYERFVQHVLTDGRHSLADWPQLPAGEVLGSNLAGRQRDQGPQDLPIRLHRQQPKEVVMELKYAGIGSRRAPPDVLAKGRQLGAALARRGYKLSSGAADGMDDTFEKGCDDAGGEKEVWLPWQGFNGHAPTEFLPTPKHFEMAATVHPAWDRLTRGPRALHARNTGQVLGMDLATPVSFVLCWTPDGCESEAERTRDTGGTGTAIVLASRLGIPVFNLAREGSYERFVLHVLADCRPFHPEGTLPQAGEVFVFGSNLAGRHGAGSALVAKEQFGAVYGTGRGRMNQCYAIPTKDGRNRQDLKDPAATLPLEAIRDSVNEFIDYAKQHPDEKFFVVRLGCVLAGHTDADIAPLFARAPSNCSFPEVWKPWLGPRPRGTVARLAHSSASSASTATATVPGAPGGLAQPINIFSGAQGLGGALTNMSERAREKGCIKHPYPVRYDSVEYADSEAAYQALKRPGQDAYNDYLMVDVIAQKFLQNRKLFDLVEANGGVWWIASCSHFTNAKSASFQSWEGQGVASRFIRNLMLGYQQAASALAVAKEGSKPTTVVHVRQAEYDEYIGRANGELPESIWHNRYRSGQDGTRPEVVDKHARLQLAHRPDLVANIGALRGKRIACWCKDKHDPKLCHGDTLAALADGRPLLPVLRPQPRQGGLFDEEPTPVATPVPPSEPQWPKGMHYRLNCGQFVQHDGDQPIGRVLDEVSLAIDREEGYLRKHGDPALVAKWLPKEQEKLRVAGLQERADALVVITGVFDLGDLNRCVTNTGYAGTLLKKLAPGLATGAPPQLAHES